MKSPYFLPETANMKCQNKLRIYNKLSIYCCLRRLWHTLSVWSSMSTVFSQTKTVRELYVACIKNLSGQFVDWVNWWKCIYLVLYDTVGRLRVVYYFQEKMALLTVSHWKLRQFHWHYNGSVLSPAQMLNERKFRFFLNQMKTCPSSHFHMHNLVVI